MSTTTYDPEQPDGWVIKRGEDDHRAAWWFGPTSGWGTTFGALHLDPARFPNVLEVDVFSTKAGALAAVRTVYGAIPPHLTAQRLKDALNEEATR
jgi:hypothetical protein